VAVLEQLLQAGVAPDERVMSRSRPLGDDVRHLHVSVTDCLDVHRVHAFSIDIRFFSLRRRLDTNVSPVDASHDVRKAGDAVECQLVGGELLLVGWKLDGYLGQLAQCLYYGFLQG